MKKLLDQRKRDKEEDKLVRQKIKEQIEAEKLARSKNMIKDGNTLAADPESVPPTSISALIRADYGETKLQVSISFERIVFF